MIIQRQVHDRFRVFVGGSVEESGMQVESFTAGATVSAKSLGVEYLEGKGRLVSRSAGILGLDGPDSIATLDSTLSEAAEAAGDVIGQALYVTDADEVHAGFLVKV